MILFANSHLNSIERCFADTDLSDFSNMPSGSPVAPGRSVRRLITAAEQQSASKKLTVFIVYFLAIFNYVAVLVFPIFVIIQIFDKF